MKGYRFRLKPTRAQAARMGQSCGVARYAWNWTLAQCKGEYEDYKSREASGDLEDGEKPKPINLGRLYRLFVDTHGIDGATKRRVLRGEIHNFGWLCVEHSHVYNRPIDALCKSYRAWWRGLKRGSKAGPPRFKRRGDDGAFQVQVTRRILGARSLNVPGAGWVRTFEDPLERVLGDVKCLAVTEVNGKWYASVTATDPTIREPADPDRVVGIDLGVKAWATLSDGTVLQMAAHLDDLERRRVRAQRVVSRRKRGSGRRRRAVQRLANLAAKIARVRRDATHKATTQIASAFGVVCIEDLNVRGMTASAKGTVESPGKNVRQKAGLNRGILRAAPAMFREILTYKVDDRAGELVVADRFFPSSKTCSDCGNVDRGLRLSDRVYRCDACGLEIDRDLNAAINLAKLAGATSSSTGGHPGTDARGQDGSVPVSAGDNQLGRSVNGTTSAALASDRPGRGAVFTDVSNAVDLNARKVGGVPRETPRADGGGANVA